MGGRGRDVTQPVQPRQLRSPLLVPVSSHRASHRSPCGRGGPGHGCSCLLHIQDHLLFLFQQQQLQHLSHHASPLPLTPHPSSMQPSSLSAASGTSGLLALSGALMAQAQLATKEDRVAQDGENRGKGKKHSWVNPLKAG